MGDMNMLHILWTNADVITAEKMVLMYALNSITQHWWEAVTVIIWGAPAKLVAENTLIQEKIRLAISVGVHFSACKACTDQLGVTDTLSDLGIEVVYWGDGLTEILKDNKKLLTI